MRPLTLAGLFSVFAVTGDVAAQAAPSKKKPAKPPVALTEVPITKTEPVAGRAASLLPADKTWKLVWNDEIDGTKLDDTKWNYRLHYWGYPSPTFTKEGVELDG
jgi:hypothetical protein